MGSCLSDEEIYLLDKTTSIETVPFVNLRGHCTVEADSGHSLDWKKEMQYFNCHITVIGMPELFITGGTKRPRAKNKTARELPETYPREREFLRMHKQRNGTPYGHPPAALGVCNLNKKQKPQFLAELGA